MTNSKRKHKTDDTHISRRERQLIVLSREISKWTNDHSFKLTENDCFSIAKTFDHDAHFLSATAGFDQVPSVEGDMELDSIISWCNSGQTTILTENNHHDQQSSIESVLAGFKNETGVDFAGVFSQFSQYVHKQDRRDTSPVGTPKQEETNLLISTYVSILNCHVMSGSEKKLSFGVAAKIIDTLFNKSIWVTTDITVDQIARRLDYHKHQINKILESQD